MIKVKEYNFVCEIVKVDLSVGPTYSSLATIKRANETGWLTFTLAWPTHSKTYKLTKSTIVIWNLTTLATRLVFYFIHLGL